MVFGKDACIVCLVKKNRREMLEQYAGSNAGWDLDNSKLGESKQLESKILWYIKRFYSRGFEEAIEKL